MIYLINISIFNISFESRNEKKKVVPKSWQEVKVKVDIITSDDIKIFYTGKFQVYDKPIYFFVNFFCQIFRIQLQILPLSVRCCPFRCQTTQEKYIPKFQKILSRPLCSIMN